jgi:hypothetical protein
MIQFLCSYLHDRTLTNGGARFGDLNLCIVRYGTGGRLQNKNDKIHSSHVLPYSPYQNMPPYMNSAMKHHPTLRVVHNNKRNNL